MGREHIRGTGETVTAPKADFKKTYKELYTAGARPGLVEAPELPFLMIDGSGDPNGEGYARAVGSLYAVAYAVRFALKGAGVLEYPVMPLQGLWWTEGEEYSPDMSRESWRWTMMIMQPPQASAEVVKEALATAEKKKPGLRVPDVRLETLREGLCAQILHLGPYAEEQATLARLYGYLEEEGLRITGRHHEIYLSRPGGDPAKMRTILRYPVARS
jgi:hypothetical protein